MVSRPEFRSRDIDGEGELRVDSGSDGSFEAGAGAAQGDDGTRQLLRWGAGTLLTGVVAALLMKTVFGGISQQGPHTNSGWLALIVAMMCLPFGFMLTLLGAAKWVRNWRHRR